MLPAKRTHIPGTASTGILMEPHARFMFRAGVTAYAAHSAASALRNAARLRRVKRSSFAADSSLRHAAFALRDAASMAIINVQYGLLFHFQARLPRAFVTG